MKKLILIFVSVSILICILTLNIKLISQQSDTKSPPQISYAQGRIVIQFKEKGSPIIPWKVDEIVQTGISSVDNLCWEFKVHTMRRQFPTAKFPTPDLTRHFLVLFDESKDLDVVVNAFSKIQFIEKVEKVGMHDILATPNDLQWGLQWYINASPGCAHIHAIEAWDIQTGSDNVALAIVDLGVKYDHQDLDDNIWINWAEFNGIEDYDDDGNGYIDDKRGWDFYQNDNTPMDINGHGTHCAGIAAAETNNNEGVVGIAGGWYPGQNGCKIMCLRVGEGRQVYMDLCASAIVYATNEGATAINCSWSSSNTGGLGDAIDYAIQNGVLVVAAAGNDNGDYCWDIWHHYIQARLDVMTIAATDCDDKRAIFEVGGSNYGECVDVSAPGKSIYNTCVKTSCDCDYRDYYFMSGTSMAAPMVVGVAGLLKSQRPDWGREKIWEAIVSTADPLQEEGMGSGRINAYKAIKQTLIPNAPSNLNAWPTAYNQINLSWQDNSDNENGFKIQRRTSSSGFSTIRTVGENVTSYQDKTCTIGVTYYYRIKAYNLGGTSSPSNTKSTTIPTGPPAAPNHLNAEFSWGRGVELTWTDQSNNEQGFKIERKSEWEPWWREIDRVGPNVTWYDDEDNLDPDTFYYYRVRAYNSYGNSSYSNIARVYVPWH